MLAGASSIALEFLFVAFVVLGLLIYLALTLQIATRRRAVGPDVNVAPKKTFGLPEVFLGGAFASLVLRNIYLALTRSPVPLSSPNLAENFLATVFIVCFIAAFLKLRGIDIDSLGGFSKTSLKRALSTAVILLLAATPLILVAEAITQNAFGGGSSRQEIVDLFNSSQTIEQRVMIIVLAVVVAPISEEFIFRFFIYGVARRYFGIAVGLVINALLFAAAHTHLPSVAPLFVLGSCFTLAYEWSGSILVSMAMHSLFNSIQLILLAFPELVQQ